MGKHLIFIGAPGSGKGTQAGKISSQLGYEHVSTGDLLRSEVAEGSDLGKRVKSVMDAGQLVSDELVVELLEVNLNLDGKNYIFDGYPRNLAQAKTLGERILKGRDYMAFYFDLETEELVKRISGRRVTRDGKHIYNLHTRPPQVAGICDVTGEELLQRDDDREEVVRKRMDVFTSTIDPVLNFYKEKGHLRSLDGRLAMEDIYAEIITELG